MELHNRAKTTSAVSAIGNDEDNTGYNEDDRDLIRLGKKPVLKASSPC